MNSVAFFRDLAKKGQGDKYEGAELIRAGQPIKYRNNIEKEKVYCMWHINNFTEPMGSGVYANYFLTPCAKCLLTQDHMWMNLPMVVSKT